MPVWPCLICSLRQKLLLLEVTAATFWRNVPSSYGRNFYSQHDGVIEWSIESSTEHAAAKWRKWKPFRRNNEYGMEGRMAMMMITILATTDCHASITKSMRIENWSKKRTELAATGVDDDYLGNNWMLRIRGEKVQSGSPTSTLEVYNTFGEHD